MLKRWREVLSATISSMERMWATGRPPLASRSAAEIGVTSVMRFDIGAHNPPERRDAGVERGHLVGHLCDRDEHRWDWIAIEARSWVSATMPTIWRAGSAKAGPAPGPISSRSFSGSPLGQYCLAMASLMMTTPGAEPSSCSVKLRPRKKRNFEGIEVAPGDRVISRRLR